MLPSLKWLLAQFRWWNGWFALAIGFIALLAWRQPGEIDLSQRIHLTDGTCPKVHAISDGSEISLAWDDKTVGLNDEILLVDRDGWRWNSQTDFLFKQSPLRFPRINATSPIAVEAVNGNGVCASSLLRVPLEPLSRDRTFYPERFPIQRMAGHLSFECTGCQLSIPKASPSRCEVHLQLAMTWNGHPFRSDIPRISIRDCWGRFDHPRLDDTGRFLTHLSPHDTAWEVRFWVKRHRDQPLEPFEEFTFEPDWNNLEELQVQDTTIDKEQCRIQFSQGDKPIRYRRRLPFEHTEKEVVWNPVGTKVAVETDGHNPRIDFLDLNGEVIHRGEQVDIPTPSNKHEERSKSIYGVSTGDILLPERYRIRVGIAKAESITITFRPR